MSHPYYCIPATNGFESGVAAPVAGKGILHPIMPNGASQALRMCVLYTATNSWPIFNGSKIPPRLYVYIDQLNLG